MTKKFKIGSTEVEINSQKVTKLIPKDEVYILDKKDQDDAEMILKGIQKNLPVLLVGPTGCGKTTTVKWLAGKTNNEYIRLQLNGSTGVDDLVGRWLIGEKGTFWIDGPLTRAVKNGSYVLLDEINAALPEILFKLHELMDSGLLTLDEKDGEVVSAHEGLRIFAAMNPSDDYAGTKEMNKALVDRFPIVLDIKYPNPEKEKDIVMAHTGMKDESTKQSERSIVHRMVEVANILREKELENTMVFTCSTRQLIYWGKLIEDYGVKKAAKITLINKAEDEDQKKIIDEINKLFRDSEGI